MVKVCKDTPSGKQVLRDVYLSFFYGAKIGIIGVGEGSTEHWSRFMDFVGIQAGEMIRECDATFKMF